MISAIQGRQTEAIALVEEAIDAGDTARWQLDYLYNPALFTLHEEPGFKSLIQGIKTEMSRQREVLQRAAL